MIEALAIYAAGGGATFFWLRWRVSAPAIDAAYLSAVWPVSWAIVLLLYFVWRDED